MITLVTDAEVKQKARDVAAKIIIDLLKLPIPVEEAILLVNAFGISGVRDAFEHAARSDALDVTGTVFTEGIDVEAVHNAFVLAKEEQPAKLKHLYRQARKISTKREVYLFGWFLAATGDADLKTVTELIEYHGLDTVVFYTNGGAPVSIIDELARNNTSIVTSLKFTD